MRQKTHTPWEHLLLSANSLPVDRPCRNSVMNTLERARVRANVAASPKDSAKWHAAALDAIDPLDVATEQWMIARLSEYRRLNA